MGQLLRRLRGVVGNAVVWGAAWFTGAFALFSVIFRDGMRPFFTYWEIVPELALAFGALGLLSGGAFSLLLSAKGAGRLGELRTGRWALAGGVVAGLTIVALSFFPGMGDLLEYPFLTVGLSSLFGAGTALTTVGLAKRALEPGEEADRLTGGSSGEFALR